MTGSMTGGMKGDIVPDADHVTRLCGGSHIREDGTIAATAYKPRPGETYLSVNWLEYFSGDREQRVRGSASMFRRLRKVGAKSAYGIGNVGRIKQVCEANATRVRVVYEPVEENSSHSEIRRLPREDLSLLDALATQAFDELVTEASLVE